MTTKTNAAPITTDLADNATPVVTIADIHLMTGSLVESSGYPTYKGRIISQIAKDTLFMGWTTYQQSRRTEEAMNSAAEDASILQALENSTSPFKNGIDGTFEEAFETNPLFGLKPRADLIFDCIKATEDMDDEIVAKIVKLIKDRATVDQLAAIAKKNTAHRNVGQGVRVGLNDLTYADESYDDLFITKAVEFVNQYPSRYPSEDDTANHGLMLACLSPRIKEGVVAPIMTFDF
jgi:hypothetical protein